MNKIEKKQLKSVFWRSFALQGAFNYERMQNVGYMYAMLPVIKKLYRNKEDQAAAITRHLEIFNTTPAVVPTIMGISAAMEEENANNPAFDVQSINAVKASLMGPLAGIGDSIFWGTVPDHCCRYWCIDRKRWQSFWSIAVLVLYNLPNLLVRIFGLKLGYQVGVNSLDRIQKEGLMDKIMAVATIVGLCVVGGMVATMLNITTPLKWNISGAEIVVQDILDQILPKMLPLAFTFGIYKLLKKASITKITIGIIIFGIAVHLIGIL